MENYQSLIVDHWPFLVVAVFLGLTGQVTKRLVIPKDNPKVLTGWRGVYRVTLPLHPAIAGALIGLLPFMPCPSSICSSVAMHSMYYMASGMLSSYAYEAVRHFLDARLHALEQGDPPAP